MLDTIQDLDFLIRARQANFKFGIVENILLSYRIRMNSISRNNELEQKYERYYLLDHDKKNITVGVDEISDYIKSLNISEKEKINYSKSRNYYKKSTVARFHGHKIKRYYYFIKSLAVSKTARMFFYKRRIAKKPII